MTTVLVGYATKMGATREIAVAVGDVLRANGLQVTVADTETLNDLEGYDSAVIGSALYLARWRASAVSLLTRQADRSERIPIWLFQSGPFETVAPGSSVGTPGKVARLARRLGAADPTTFGGRLGADTARGFMARRMAAGEAAGDHRDFEQIRSWATDIAHQLTLPVSNRH